MPPSPARSCSTRSYASEADDPVPGGPQGPGTPGGQRGNANEDGRAQELTVEDVGGGQREEDDSLGGDNDALEIVHRRVPGRFVPGSPVRARCSLRAASYSSRDLNSSASSNTFLVAVSQSRGRVFNIGNPCLRR